MNKYPDLKYYIIPAVLLLLMFAVGYSFRSSFMANLIAPASLFFWAIWRVITSVDQNLYWILLLALCTIPLVRLVVFDSGQRLQSAYEDETTQPGWIQRWDTLLREARLGRGEHERLVQAIGQLLLSSVQPIDEADMNLSLEQSDQVQAVLSAPMKDRLQEIDARTQSTSGVPMLDLPANTPAWVKNFVLKLRRSDLDWIDKTLSSMEDELDIYDG